jgi:hypothetical protein
METGVMGEKRKAGDHLTGSAKMWPNQIDERLQGLLVSQCLGQD